MAKEPLHVLTQQETNDLARDYPQFIEKVLKMEKEQNELLRTEILSDKNIDDATRTHLLKVLNQGGYKTALYRITDANAAQKSNTQITYNIHDDLFDYLRRPTSQLPKKLRGFLDGGSLIDPAANKPMMEDLAPKTGKTRTGVPKYDAILEAQERGKKP